MLSIEIASRLGSVVFRAIAFGFPSTPNKNAERTRPPLSRRSLALNNKARHEVAVSVPNAIPLR